MRLRVVFVALLAVVASACQVDAAVDVVVEEDGSGSVTLTLAFDEEVVVEAPELLAGLRTEDLDGAGWAIEGPRRTDTGGMVVTATKGFEVADDLAGVLAEIAGPDVLFSDFNVQRQRTFARTTYTITGRIDSAVNLERPTK